MLSVINSVDVCFLYRQECNADSTAHYVSEYEVPYLKTKCIELNDQLENQIIEAINLCKSKATLSNLNIIS